MKTISLPLAALAVAATLGACKPEAKVVDNRAPDPLAAEKAKAPKAVLPPPIKANAVMRCKDNSLVYVDFFQGDTLVNFREKETDTPVQLKADAPGEPFKGNGITVTGTPKSITLDRPDKGEVTCRV